MDHSALRMRSTFVATVVLAALSGSALADIAITGSVNPADYSTWGDSTYLAIGDADVGQADLSAGASVSVNSTIVGYSSGINGTLNVDASTFNNSASLVVGSFGSGTLNITGGAVVSNQTGVAGGYWSGSGKIAVSGSGSKWINSGDLLMNSGSLTINNGGYVSYGGSNSGIGSGASIQVSGGSSKLAGNSFLRVYGSLNVNNGAKVETGFGFVGGDSGPGAATASAKVDGSDSKWTTNGDLLIGSNSGMGVTPSTLTIINGAAVQVYGSTFVGSQFTGADGQIVLGGGGTLATQSLYASKGQLVGNGTVNTKGIVTDGELIFDRNHAAVQSLNWNDSGSTITVNIDVGQDYSRGDVGIGWHGAGSMTIKDGLVVYSRAGRIGYGFGSSGKVTVDGTDSIWRTGALYAGTAGGAKLNITNGGKVYSQNITTLGSTSLGKTVVKVDGTGSFFDMAGATLGDGGKAVLHVTGGAIVSANSLTIGSKGLAVVDVGNGSILGVNGGTGTITNNGTLRLIAARGAVSGDYKPLNILSLGTSGTSQFLGGRWSTGSKTFSITDAIYANAGSMASLDRSVSQRLIVSIPASTQSVELNFAASDPSNVINVTADVADVAATQALKAQSGGQNVLAAWNFDINGDYGSVVNLNMQIGAGWDADALTLWHYGSGVWTALAADDQNYDGLYANFTVDGFSGYAVTAVPEPTSLGLLGGALAALMMRRRAAKQN